ncbi:hypothetical protein D3C75_468860 [compost metagenome]
MHRRWEGLLVSGYSYEIYWLIGVIRDPTGWMIKFLVRKAKTQIYEEVIAPLNEYSGIIIGTLHKDGQRLGVSRGGLSTVEISNASDFSRVPVSGVPTELYPMPAQYSQDLFAYSIGNHLYLIPESELIRGLFALDAYLSDVVISPAGLCLLVSPQLEVQGGRYYAEFSNLISKYHQTVTRLEHYIWLAFDDDVRRAWDSIGELSSCEKISFNPPPIKLSLIISSIQRGDVHFVTEIVHSSSVNAYAGLVSQA